MQVSTTCILLREWCWRDCRIGMMLEGLWDWKEAGGIVGLEPSFPVVACSSLFPTLYITYLKLNFYLQSILPCHVYTLSSKEVGLQAWILVKGDMGRHISVKCLDEEVNIESTRYKSKQLVRERRKRSNRMIKRN